MIDVLNTGMIHKIVAGISAAAILGGGSVVLSTATKVAVAEARIAQLEDSRRKLDEVVTGVIQLNGKVDVLNQKLDDAKEELHKVSRR